MSNKIKNEEIESLFEAAEKEGYNNLSFVAKAEEFCVYRRKKVFIYTAVFINEKGNSKRFCVTKVEGE